METKAIRRFVSLALTLAMALTLLPAPAWAAVAHDAPMWGKAMSNAAGRTAEAVRVKLLHSANGPSGDTSGGQNDSAHLWICNTVTGLATTELYNAYGSVNNSAGGAAYDLASNTLSLTNYNGVGTFLEARAMGEDFTIRLAGSSELDVLLVYGTGYGGSLHVVGDGSLTVNGTGNAARFLNSDAQNPIYEDGLRLYAGGGSAKLTVSAASALTVRGYNNGEAIAVKNTTEASGGIDGNLSNGTVRRTSPRVGPVQAQPENTGDGTANFAFLCEKENSLYGVQQSTYYNNDVPVSQYSIYNLTKTETGYTYGDRVSTLTSEEAIAEAGYSIICEEGRYIYEVVDGTGAPLSVVSFTPTGAGRPTILTDSLAKGIVGVAYSATLSATPGTGGKAITWSASGLPDGLTLNETTGAISGTPRAAGAYSVAVTASEEGGGIAGASFTLLVRETVINTESLPNALLNAEYSAALSATGAVDGAITWSASSLPDGLTLNETTGAISGTPTAQGSYRVTVTATEAGGGTATKELTLTVAEAKSVTYLLNGGTAGDSAAYGEAFSVASGAVIALPAAPTKSDEKGALTFAGWKVTSEGQAQGYTYNAGNAFTVNKNVTFTAQWERELKADYKGQVIGWVGLYGVKGGNSTSLWGEYYDTVQPSVRATVPVWQMRDKSYDRLDLHATVDGMDAVIASYNSTVNQTTGAVELTGALAYTVLNGVVVTGLTQETDYYLSSVVHRTAASADKNIYLYDSPILVSTDGTYTVELSGVKGSANYDKYDWSATNGNLILSDGKLTVTPTPISATATVTGTVTVNSGSSTDTPSGVTVTATQIVGGVARSVSATTEPENGAKKYTLHLIPGHAATFTASYQGQQLSVTDGATLSSVTGGATHDLTALSNLLTVTITPDTAGMDDGQRALADRYLRSLVRKSYSWYGGENYITVTSGGASRSESVSVTGISGTTRSYSLDFIKTSSTALTVSANVPGLVPMSGSVALSGSRATVTFTPALTPGVVVDLSATRGSDVFTAWYGSDGSYKGKSETFTLSSIRVSWGIPCPAQDKTGAFKIVLLPASYDGCVENLSYSELPAEAELTHWDTTLTAGRVTDLGAYSLDAAASENAAFVTKPGSTMTASAQSFSSESDLIAFTGRIGLDDGCKNGRLIGLHTNAGNSVSESASSSVPRGLVINGTSYPLPGTQSSGDYHVDLSAYNIPLPCDYTLYCSPGSVSWEMAVSLSADVTYNTGTNAYRQLIGRAVVEKPDAYITTLSSYVCDEQITVEGTAVANRSVTIYDNDVVVGTATADRYGDWTAIVTLAGTDAQYVTAHSIHSVSETGVMSDEITVFHQPGGAQLTGFTMSYTIVGEGRMTVNVGDTYTAGSGGIHNVSFAVTVKNPEQLEVLTEGFNSKVTVKVYTNDGQIRFVPATEGPSGTFVATVGDLPALVSGAEAMMLPITKTNPVTDGGLTIDEGTVGYVHDLLGQVLDQYNRDNHTAYTGFSDIWVNSTPGELAFMQDGSGNLTVTAGTASAGELADVKAKMDEANASLAGSGMTIEGSAVQTQNGYDDNSGVAATVRAMAAQNRTVSGTASLITEQCFFSQLQTLLYDFRKTLDLGAEVSMQSGSFDLNNAAAAVGDAFFVLSLSGSGYDISVAYVVSTDSKFYMRSITATFHDSFTGFPAGFAAVTGQDGAFTVQQSLVLASKPMTPYERAQLEAQQEALENSWITMFINNCRSVEGYGMLHLELVIGLFQHVLASSVGAVLTTWDGVKTISQMSETCQKRYQELKKYSDDLDELKQHPCYQAMSPTHRSLCEGLYQKYVDEEDLCATVQMLTGMAVTFSTLTSIVSAGVAIAGCLPASAVSIVSGSAGYFIGLYGQLWADNQFTKASDAYQQCYMKTAQCIRATAQEYEGDDCKNGKKKNKDGINGKTTTPAVHDPSGVVYEGVLENPVEGATATLYFAADGNEAASGMIKETSLGSGTPTRTPTQLLTASDVRGLTPNDPVQVTGADGRYQWFVPEGLWFVTAEKGGLSGNSNGDSAATVNQSVGVATKLLPVLPPQLNVNIPLVDNSVPYVTDVQYKTDGVYVTFSKYMVDTGSGTDSVLNENNYTLMNDAGRVTITGVEPVEQGSTPANRGAVTTYTRTVKLTTSEALTAGNNVTLTVAPWVTSYAGVPMGTAYSSGGTAQAPQQLAAPVFSGVRSDGGAFGGSAVEALMNRGDGLTIAAETGAKIYYTTDGTGPSSSEDGTTKLYSGPIAVSGSMTVKAIAVKIGYTVSSVATAEITQRAVGTRSNGSPVSVDPTPAPTPQPSYTDDRESVGKTSTVPATGSAGTVDLGVTVSGGTARVAPLSGSDVAQIVGAGGGNANVVMDFSSLGGKIETVSIPDASFDRLAKALETHDGNDSLTIKTANGSVRLNEAAASAAANAGGAGSVALTVKSSGANTLSASERAALGGREAEAVYTLGLTSNGRDVGAPGGGFVTAELPFIADAGKDPLGYRVYRLNDDGTATLVPSAVHDGIVTMRSNRLAKLAVVFEPLTVRFDDVSVGAYYGDAVAWALANGVTNGIGDERFAPDEPCTRAQIVTFLWRAAGCPKPGSAASEFADVPVDAWYGEAVAWAVENGVTNGMGDGIFGVDKPCTRAQVMALLYRMDGGEVAAPAPFADVPGGQWYSVAVAWTAACGITNGVGDGRFGVGEVCTRGQIVTVLYRWFNK